jgi:ABC-type transport system involved in cytochrome c biogenesis permease subunit
MATSELAHPGVMVRGAAARTTQISATQFTLSRVLAVLASLRLTVALFALSIILVFVGTLAQKDYDVWYVVQAYFRTWFAWVEFVTFERFVQIFFKSVEWNLSGGFYFFGGKLIGLLLLVNLAAAHAVRFKIEASGRRLAIGCGVLAAGLVLTYLAIQSGMNGTVESALSREFCDMLWQFFRGSLVLATLALAYGVFFLRGRMRTFEWGVLLVTSVLLAGLAVWLLANPQARLDDSGLRILWQLLKATGAGIVLLVGCIMVFRKRAGIVLLHGGVALMMVTELLTAVSAQESRMAIPEGGTVSYSDDIRTTELAVIDRSHEEHDHVTVVPASLLVKNVGQSGRIEHADLPFDIQVHRWMPNSQLRDPKASETNSATAGFGTRAVAESVAPATGVGEDAQKVDAPSAYIELFSKTSGESLGTYLASLLLKEQTVQVDGKSYDLALRFKRLNHPYSLTLKDFNFGRYVGTNTAKDYSSQVVLKDPDRNIDREVSIWMNNPLRYAGTTFYQADFDHETERGTVLQVVTNPAWMTPYVACMLVQYGMLAHFGTILFRFLRRRGEVTEGVGSPQSTSPFEGTQNGKPARHRKGGSDSRPRTAHGSTSVTSWPTLAKLFPALVVLLFAGYVVSKARVPESPASEMQIYEFGKLPLAYQGRIKPYDTLARNSLQILSGRQQVGVQNAKGEVVAHLPAIRWLLDVISGSKAGDDHRVFRIENLDLLEALGLQHRPLFWRYSLNEIEKKPGELRRQVALVKDIPEDKRSLFQNKVLELYSKYNLYQALNVSFRSPPISLDQGQEALIKGLDVAKQIVGELRAFQAPHAVPPKDGSTAWTPLFEAEFDAIRDHFLKQPINPGTFALRDLLLAYNRGDATDFNKQLAAYRRVLGNYESRLEADASKLKQEGVANAEILSQPKVNFEVFYNYFSPFYYAQVLYVFAFILGVLSWVGWTKPLRRGSMWLLWFTFALHTFALVARIYISGRPPVTNLYSTGIFIGWAGVIMALLFESIYRLGLGNIVASVVGFLTLLVAYNLSLDGDTFIVLQAVLDTQFWLATHVVTINLGYAATFMAGAWGAMYILLAHVFPVLDQGPRRDLLRVLYGTLCFAIFFSFIGTVLGGLWADDSWGRFWGWDPKENGALIIVLWNALVLHARWGAMVKGRGLAALAVAGNIVTTWSWFGVNELGVGLHSYGASEKNTAMWLLIFGASQLALIALAMMPQRWFESLSANHRHATLE